MIALKLEAVCYKNCNAIAKYQWITFNAAAVNAFGPKQFRFSANYGNASANVEQLAIDLQAIGEKQKILSTAKLLVPTVLSFHVNAMCLQQLQGKELLDVFEPKCAVNNTVANYRIVQVIDALDKHFELTLAKNIIPEFDARFSTYTSDHPQFMVDNAQMVTLAQVPIKANVLKDFSAQYSSTVKVAKDMYNWKKASEMFCPNPSRLGKEGRVLEAVQVINALTPKLFAEEKNSASKTYSVKLYTRILEDMLTFPTESVLNSLIVVLVRLIRPIPEPKDWRYALALSNTCKHLTQIRRHDLKRKNVLLYEGTVINEYRVFKECAAFLMTSNYKKLTNRVTTVPPLDNHDTISEDYPFYGDIATEFQQNNYMTIICSAIDIAVSASLIRSVTSSYGEPETMENGEYFQADRFDMAKKEITMIRCKINLPSDAGFNSSEKVKVIINIFNESIFFWGNTDMTVNTVLVNLLFVDIKGKEIYTFPQLTDIYLNTSEQLSSLFQKLTAGLPVGHTEFNDTNVPVFRIDLRQTSHIRISFRNVSQPIKIVIQHGKRPLISDLEQSTVVGDNFTAFNIESTDYDDWLYIAVAPLMLIPHLDSKSAKVIQYNEYSNIESNTFEVSVLTQQCIRLKDNEWQQSDCTLVPDTTTTLVHCRCYTTANVAGSSISSNLEERHLVVLRFSLEYSPNYIPLILTMSVIFLYCVVLIFAVFRRKTEQHIYYLGDNLPTHNYAYLTMVKTNGKLSSGTTANIVIKLHGMKSQSSAHVLNYPDPDKNLLQCGSEDYFVLTSRQYLGELNHIELWTDWLYIRPTWRCDYVKICDLQNKKWYTFNVNNIFSPLKKIKHYVSISPEEVHVKARKKLSFRRIAKLFTLRYGAEHTWNVFSKKDDRSFSFIERLSVLLTFIISTYAVTMLMCIFPNFTPTDGIDDGKIMAYLELVKYAFLTSCVTFPINTLLVFMFRNLTRKRGLRFFHNKKPFSEKIKYINWALLCVLISTSTVYVLFMSTGISLVSSYAWLIITTASLLINIIILENFYLGTLDIVNIVLQSKAIYNYKEIIKESQRQKEYLSQIVASRYSLRPYLTHLYKPMDAVRYNRKTVQLITRLKISKTFQECIAFIIYILLLHFLIGVMHSSHIIILNEHVKRMMEGKVGGLQLKEIHSRQQLVQSNNAIITFP